MTRDQIELHQRTRQLLDSVCRKLEWFAQAVQRDLFCLEVSADLRAYAAELAQHRDSLVPELKNSTGVKVPRGRRRKSPASSGNGQDSAELPPAAE